MKDLFTDEQLKGMSHGQLQSAEMVLRARVWLVFQHLQHLRAQHQRVKDMIGGRAREERTIQ
jgi:hypothetical protein